MSKIKIYNKTLVLLVSGTLMSSLVGCGNKNISNNAENIDNTMVQETYSGNETTTTESSTTSNTTNTISSATSTDSEKNETITSTIDDNNTTTTNNNIYNNTTIESDADNVVLDSFKKMGDNIKENIDSKELLDKGKTYFIYCVDFLFYDGEIKGYTFNDMTDRAKQQLLQDITTIDTLISSKFPNYKETISGGSSDAYNKASEIIKAGSNNINDFSREKLGEENYNKIQEYKDMFIEQAFSDYDDFKDIIDQGVSKVKDWYEGLR